MGVVRVIETLNDVEEVKPDNNVLFRMMALLIHNPEHWTIHHLSQFDWLDFFYDYSQNWVYYSSMLLMHKLNRSSWR